LLLVDALAATGTLRQAAARLNMAQPAATRLLSELETALEVRLFERSPQGMTATRFGESMIEHARRVLTDIDHAGADVTALAQGEQGHVHVGAFVSATAALLPRCVALIKAERPAVRIRIEVAGNNALLAGLRNHDLDLVVGRVLGQSDTDLVYNVLYNESFRVVARPGHPLAKRNTLSLTETIDAPWILPSGDGPMRHNLNALFAAQAGCLPRNVVETVSMLASLQILRGSDFLAVLPERVADEYAAHGMVALLPLRFADLLGPIALVTRAGPLRSRAVEAFRDAVLTVGGALAALERPAPASRSRQNQKSARRQRLDALRE
jgi:DNA-binding transcriptional LysR family regulator